MNDKTTLRKSLRNRRKTVENREAASAQAVRNLMETTFFRTAKTVLVYVSINSELETQTLISSLLVDAEKTCVVPYCLPDGELGLFRLEGENELAPGAYGIREPRPELRATRNVSVEELNLVVLPGVGFDVQGNRLGQGGGYYDRLLRRLPSQTRTVGLAYACQKVAELPTEPHDRKIDTLVTEQGVHRFGPHVIGILGGIACGKSLVSETFAARGIPVFDADKTGHEAYHDPAVQEKILRLFGTLDRSAIAKSVFAKPDALRALNAAVHPWILEKWCDFYRNATAPTVVLDAALLLETGWATWCDTLIFVDTPREKQRALARNRGWTDDELLRRERSQWPLSEKKKKADVLLKNTGSKDELRQSILTLYDQLCGIGN
ncbi:MAG: 5-formyltetrahydrofolate cyclo-ligase [Planctomycetia bacterium]|nr:5-formyltetrahydrofolate cyclo-ligase [Planctomycetia bacterium]